SSGHDVELTAIRPEKSRKASLFEEVPFRIEVVGDYFSLYDWMVEVEEKLGPMVVKKFAIVEDYKTKKLLLKMSIVSYRLEQEEM
ncbi:MAG: type 4a pilus biogenesis protein PilO, partial [Nitrospinota bacterium]